MRWIDAINISAINFSTSFIQNDVATFTFADLYIAETKNDRGFGIRKKSWHTQSLSLFACKVIFQDYCYYSFIQLKIPGLCRLRCFLLELYDMKLRFILIHSNISFDLGYLMQVVLVK